MTDSAPYHITRGVEPLASDFILDSYLMHIRTQRCACGAVEQWSETLEVSVHRHNGARRLVPAPTPDRNYPVGISRLPVREIAICHCCVLSSEPTARDLSHHNAQVEWSHTLARKYRPEAKLERKCWCGFVYDNPNATTHVCTTMSAAMTKAASKPGAPRLIADVEDL
jgi:hypothetical protein